MIRYIGQMAESSEELAARLSERIRALRAEKKWSLEALAKSSGVSRSMLSQIERNEVNPTLAVLLSIARAFGVSLGELVDSEQPASTMHVIRADDRQYHYHTAPDHSIRTLSPLNLEKEVEFYEVQLEPAGALRSAPHYKGTREFLTVQKGKVRVESAQEAVELGRGDSVNYQADVPHAIVNLGSGPALIFLVVLYPH
jgi:transcriptional regulator with XRE-family HTH domain